MSFKRLFALVTYTRWLLFTLATICAASLMFLPSRSEIDLAREGRFVERFSMDTFFASFGTWPPGSQNWSVLAAVVGVLAVFFLLLSLFGQWHKQYSKNKGD